MDISSHCWSCGRPFGKLEHIENDEVKYCSKLCRKEKLERSSSDLENYITKKLTQLSHTNICPSQISREHFGDEWRQHHQKTVKACRRLFLNKKIVITQKKKTITDLNFKGPFRIKK